MDEEITKAELDPTYRSEAKEDNKASSVQKKKFWIEIRNYTIQFSKGLATNKQIKCLVRTKNGSP